MFISKSFLITSLTVLSSLSPILAQGRQPEGSTVPTVVPDATETGLAESIYGEATESVASVFSEVTEGIASQATEVASGVESVFSEATGKSAQRIIGGDSADEFVVDRCRSRIHRE